MAPTPGIDRALHAMLQLSPRGIGSQIAYSPFTQDQQTNLQIIALTFSSISVAGAIISFYWFVRMRRSFRHDLIMVLIQSDMFKSLWFWFFPIVTFSNGPVASDDVFCHINGFFLALGIEASDFAVLMIAIDAALQIFRPSAVSGEGGLYRYRYYAFGLYIALPVLAASLGFINKDGPFISAGTYCYFPIRPFWYRLALSWIPRYIIFIIILSIYIAIYIYVKYKFRGFARALQRRQSSIQPVEDGKVEPRHIRPPRRYDLPRTPPLALHGLIPDSLPTSGKPSISSTIGSSRTAGSQVTWNHPAYHFNSSPDQSPLEEIHPHHVPNSTVPGTTTTISANDHSVSSKPPSASTSWTTYVSRFLRRSGNRTDSTTTSDPSDHPTYFSLRTFLRLQTHHPDSSTILSTPTSQLELVDSNGSNIAVHELVRVRERIRRQLRYSFIYPLVYMLMWTMPFISHALQYSDSYAAHPSYVVSCISTVFVTSSAWVDCLIFSFREKPWRLIASNSSTMGADDGGFWESFAFWKIKLRHEERGGSVDTRRRIHIPGRGGRNLQGRSRAEMRATARDAYKRRDVEMAEHVRVNGLATANASAAASAAGSPAARSPTASVEAVDHVYGHQPLSAHHTPLPSPSIASSHQLHHLSPTNTAQQPPHQHPHQHPPPPPAPSSATAAFRKPERNWWDGVDEYDFGERGDRSGSMSTVLEEDSASVTLRGEGSGTGTATSASGTASQKAESEKLKEVDE